MSDQLPRHTRDKLEERRDVFGKGQKQVFAKWERDKVDDPRHVVAENRWVHRVFGSRGTW